MNRRYQNYQPNTASVSHYDSKATKFLKQEWLWISVVSVLLFLIAKVVILASTWLITTFGLTSSFLSF